VDDHVPQRLHDAVRRARSGEDAARAHLAQSVKNPTTVLNEHPVGKGASVHVSSPRRRGADREPALLARAPHFKDGPVISYAANTTLDAAIEDWQLDLDRWRSSRNIKKTY